MKHFIILLLASVPIISLAQLKNVVLEDKPVPKPMETNAIVNNWDESQNGYSNLTPSGKEFYYWANYSRANPKAFWDSAVLPILNTFQNLTSSYSESLKRDLYSQTQLPLLKLNSKLIQTAQAHATDIGIHKGQPGHISTDGRTFAQRIKAVGIKYCGGENVSIGDVDPILSLVLLYIDYGIPTLGHRKALLNPSYTETGIGVSKYGDDGTLFIVQDFSCTQ